MASAQISLFEPRVPRGVLANSSEFLRGATSANDSELPRRMREWIVPNVAVANQGLIVDLFAGGGGFTEGMEKAYGRPVDIAINHCINALILHAVNHPETEHFIEDVFAVDPVKACRGRPVAHLHGSPTCTHFSRARAGSPLEYHEARRIRGLAWVIVRWAAAVRPALITAENVPEMLTWSRVGKDGKADKQRKGEYFRKWVRKLEALGYEVQWKILKAADFGSPTIRERLYIVARCDGGKIEFPEPTHGPGREHPHVQAAQILDWTLPSRSIFERGKKMLRPKSLKRIAAVVVRHILQADDPFVVPQVEDRTIRLPSISIHRGGRIGASVRQPLHTVTSGAGSKRPAGAAHAMGVVEVDAIEMAAMAQHNEGEIGWPVTQPMSTLLKKCSQQQLVTATLTSYYSSNNGSAGDLRLPIGTVTAGGNHHGVVETTAIEAGPTTPEAQRVASFLQRYYTPRARDPDPTFDVLNGRLIYRGRAYQIVDIKTRMIEPRECFRAQGFSDDYIIDPVCTYRTKSGRYKRGRLPKHEQVAKAGNSVCPQVAEALVRANLNPFQRTLRAAA